MTVGGLVLIAFAALLFIGRLWSPRKQPGVSASHGGIAIGGDNSGDVRSVQSHSSKPTGSGSAIDILNVTAAICSIVGLFLTIWGMVK